jgi:hypothetical protein
MEMNDGEFTREKMAMAMAKTKTTIKEELYRVAIEVWKEFVSKENFFKRTFGEDRQGIPSVIGEILEIKYPNLTESQIKKIFRMLGGFYYVDLKLIRSKLPLLNTEDLERLYKKEVGLL